MDDDRVPVQWWNVAGLISDVLELSLMCCWMQQMEESMREFRQLNVHGTQAVMERDPEEEQEDGWERALVVVTSDEHEGTCPAEAPHLSLPNLFMFQASLEINSINHFGCIERLI